MDHYDFKDRTVITTPIPFTFAGGLDSEHSALVLKAKLSFPEFCPGLQHPPGRGQSTVGFCAVTYHDKKKKKEFHTVQATDKTAYLSGEM